MHANVCDQSTIQIAEALRAPFKILGKDLSQDYGGTIKYLWIDFELNKGHAEHRPAFPFRFQKKVGGSVCKLTGLPRAVYENVGHYSVRPDFQEMLNMPVESVANYALSLIYSSTNVLIQKQKKLGGFDAQKFRVDFLSSCKKHGFEIEGQWDKS